MSVAGGEAAITSTAARSMLADLAAASEHAATGLRKVAPPSPLVESAGLSRRFDCRVLLKCEHLLPTGSFKLRGAYARISALGTDRAKAGVVAASSGNHGLGVAQAARLRGIEATVHAPAGASRAKLDAIERLGAALVLHEGDCLVAESAARAAAAKTGACYISPYNDIGVIAGQGGAAVEMLEQCGSIDAVIVSVGGGGLLCGIGAVLASRSPETELVGAWSDHSTPLLRALEAGRIISVAEKPTLADATAGALEPDTVTLPLAMELAPTTVEVAEARIGAAMRLIAEEERWIVEGAAALALAALEPLAPRLRGKTVAIVLCGRNILLNRFLEAVA
jgi:threonine dehydratase